MIHEQSSETLSCVLSIRPVTALLSLHQKVFRYMLVLRNVIVKQNAPSKVQTWKGPLPWSCSQELKATQKCHTSVYQKTSDVVAHRGKNTNC